MTIIPKTHIVRTYSSPNGATGESTIHVDNRGNHWREVICYNEQGTGDRRGELDRSTGEVTER